MSRFLVFVFVLQLFGVVIFLRGYLLTRVVVSDTSPVCGENDLKCFPRRFKRVVWLLIDALRYDFVEYNMSSFDTKQDVPFYINKMTNTRNFLQQRPRNTKLFRFVADPPTTTMQRLKALTTGTLPTFIDISSNFNSYEIQEDNIIKQCKRHGLNVVFMGDDTWIGMYGNIFDKSYPFPSLNVKDLHTVDEGVYKHLMPELKENFSDFVIGHFLGVDHCGHTYGPNNKMMRDKLMYIDNVIKSVFDSVDNETIVFVFGDHGMTATGDHGGETEQETVAALLIYTPQSIFEGNKPNGELVYQTDLVPTVSLLLGIPIPFSNLGMIIPELFKDTSLPNINNNYLTALKVNSHQLNTFITVQSKLSNDLSFNQVVTLQEMYDKISSKRLNENNLNMKENERLHELYMRNVRELCVSTWAQFDIPMMSLGIIVLFVHLIVLVSFLNELSWIRRFSSNVNWIDVVSFLIAAIHSVAMFSNSLVVYEGVMVSFFIQSLVLVLLIVKLRQLVASFTQEHGQWEHIVEGIKSSYQFILIMICVRVSLYFHTCRDQQDDCFIPQILERPDTLFSADEFHRMLLYIVQFIVSLLAFIFALFYGTYQIGITFGQEHKQFLLSKWGYWLLKCALVIVFLSEISLPDILSVILFWIYIFGFAVTFYLALMLPYDCQNKTVFNSHVALLPYSWLMLSLWILICLLIKCTNQVLLIPLSLSFIQLVLTTKTVCKMSQVSLFTRAVICSLFSHQFFFSYGHQATVTSLRFEAAFTGLYGDLTSLTLPIAGILVGINLLASQILLAIALPLFLPHGDKHQPLLKLQLFYILIGSAKLMCTVLAAMILRRHLMIWAVFGPRFMYEVAFQCLSNILCIFCNIVISYYRRLTNKLNKTIIEKDI